MFNFLADKISDRFSAATMAKYYRRTSPGITRSLGLYRFRKTIRWAAAHSPFYKKAFAERGIDAARVRTPADLGDFYTTPDDIVREPQNFICQTPAIVFESSGTSGRNKQVYFTRRELESMGETQAAGLQLMGLTRDDRVANAFDFCIWIPGLMTHYALMSAGVFCQAFGKVDPVEVYRRLEQYKFTVILGEPTWLIRLTELAERDGSRHKLKLLVGGAEEMPQDAIPWMNRVWNGATVKMCYGTVEQGHSMAFQPCDNHDGYHLDVVDFLPEIIEPDENGYGELVFTTLRRRTMPLIRYRTRDVTRFQPACSCGIPAQRIEKLLGRRDELIVASGGNLYPLMFENILRPVHGITHDFQVVFKLAGVREVMEINVESSRTDTDRLFDEIKQQATIQYPDLMKNLALGIFEMTLEVHAPGSIRSARKLKRIVDRRFLPVDDSPVRVHDHAGNGKANGKSILATSQQETAAHV
jgi:phenylacetate-CoA ligase